MQLKQTAGAIKYGSPLTNNSLKPGAAKAADHGTWAAAAATPAAPAFAATPAATVSEL